MSRVDALDRGRESFRRQHWGDAYAQLSAAGRQVSLEPDDLERLAVAAYLAGRDADSEEAWTGAHHQSLAVADWGRAARCAFWLGITLINRMEPARGGGWLARAQRVLDDAQHQCVERGWLLVPVALRQYHLGDFVGSATIWAEAANIGASYNDVDLVTTARQGQGRTLIRLGRTAEGVALLDEAMVAVAAGELSPIPAGIVYCSVIEACQEILDVRRAQEWTKALSDWCASQPDLVPYRGRCLIHRSEIMQLSGAWPEATDEARRACERLSAPPQPQLGAAFYQRAELHRLRGEFTMAEDAYRQASQRGRIPEPGLALLRLAQGRADAAAAAIRRAVEEAKDLVSRSKVLPAYVEIMLATNDDAAARTAAEELAGIADGMDLPYLRAVAGHAQGAVLLAEGDAWAALEALRGAWASFEELQVPYEAARLRVLAGLACQELRDEEGAELERDGARRVFEQLGAAPDLARLQALRSTAVSQAAGGLTAREVQVLALVATGKSNREIAAELVISERTVARHMSNIFIKLNVSSRTAASAFAFEHDLV
jgi:DNA-binding CsgD family transcriptional regulator